MAKKKLPQSSSPKQSTKARKSKKVSRQKRNRRPPIIKLALTAFVLAIAWLIYLDALVTSKFEGHKWAIPAKVYAQPIELYPGLTIDIDDIQNQLRRQGYLPVRNLQRPGTFIRDGANLIIYTRNFAFPEQVQRAQKVRIHFQGGIITQLQKLSGTDSSLVRLDPQLIGGIYPANYEDRILVKLNKVPHYLTKGLVAVEDRRFYRHHGISLRGIARAVLADIKSGRLVQGGSTLTQQLVKNFYLDSKRTLWRKAQEVPMALLLELHYSKQQILESYLNEVFLGQQGRLAIHGFGTASQFYFYQKVEELSISRAALLIALVKGASYYNPWRYPKRALKRRNLVIDVMAQAGVISLPTAARAKKQPLGVVSKQRIKTNIFPAYLDLVKRQLKDSYDKKTLTSQGLRIFTNMNPITQQQAQKALAYAKKTGAKTQGAMLVTNTKTADIEAIVGDVDNSYSGFNRALDARRNVGSLIKPAVYLTALDNPRRYSLSTLIKDEPFTLKLAKNKTWKPDNYSHTSHGLVPLYQGLVKSYNLATARLGMDLGLHQVRNTLQRLGVKNLPKTPLPSLLLGALDMSPYEVTQMYQTIASEGFNQPLQAISAVQTAQGELLQRFPIQVKKQFSSQSIYLLEYAMHQVMIEGTGRSAYWDLPKKTYLAGKTGTTNRNRDSWFAGFTQNQLAVVWLGHDDNSPTRLTGATGALKVWRNFMQQVKPQSQPPVLPAKIKLFWIDTKNNSKTKKGCKNAKRLPFVHGSQPKKSTACSLILQRFQGN